MEILISLSAKGEEDDLDLDLGEEETAEEPAEKPKKAPPKKAPAKKEEPTKKVLTLEEAIKLTKKAKKKRNDKIDRLLKKNKVSDKQFAEMDIGDAKPQSPVMPNVWNINGDGYKPRELTDITDMGAPFMLPPAQSAALQTSEDWLKSIGYIDGQYPATFDMKYADYWDSIQAETPIKRVLQFLQYMHTHGLHPEKPRTTITKLYAQLLEGDLQTVFDTIKLKVRDLRINAYFKQSKLTCRMTKDGAVIFFHLVPKRKTDTLMTTLSSLINIWYDRSLPVAYQRFDKSSTALKEDLLIYNRWYPIKHSAVSFHARTVSKPDSLVLRVDFALPNFNVEIAESTKLNMFKKLVNKYCKVS